MTDKGQIHYRAPCYPRRRLPGAVAARCQGVALLHIMNPRREALGYSPALNGTRRRQRRRGTAMHCNLAGAGFPNRCSASANSKQRPIDKLLACRDNDSGSFFAQAVPRNSRFQRTSG